MEKHAMNNASAVCRAEPESVAALNAMPQTNSRENYTWRDFLDFEWVDIFAQLDSLFSSLP